MRCELNHKKWIGLGVGVAVMGIAATFMIIPKNAGSEAIEVKREQTRLHYEVDRHMQATLEQRQARYATAIERAVEIREATRREEALKTAIYIMESGKKLYSDDAFKNPVKDLERGTVLYRLAEGKDKDGKVTSYQVRLSIDDEKAAGFIKASDALTDLTKGMAHHYKGVDYKPFDNPNFTENPKVKVKGIYISIHTATLGDQFWKKIDEAQAAGVNAVVIDIKDDNEYLLFKSLTADKYNPKANEKTFIKDPKAFVKKLRDKKIYLIGRIVTFKSPGYANAHHDRAIIVKDTNKLHSDSGMIWASPYDRDLWQYNIGVAKEAASYGFNEIQFDYVRFPASNGGKLDAKLDYRNKLNESKSEAIQKFLIEARKELHAQQTYVSADVFGWTASEITDVGIGQHWESMTNVTDYMCSMIYPSHYGPGNYGIAVPDAKPYETVLHTMTDALERDANVIYPATQRPWIQDFTATWVKGHIRYGDAEVAAQIKALKDLGIDEYILWNPMNRYHYGGLR